MPRRTKSTRVVPVETFHTSSKVLDAMHRPAQMHPRDIAVPACRRGFGLAGKDLNFCGGSVLSLSKEI